MFRRLSLLSAVLPTAALAHPVLDATQAARALRRADAPSISAQAYADALSGRIVTGIESVDGVAVAKAWGLAVVDTPIEAAWMAINDESRMGGRMPVSVSEVIGGTPKSTPRRVFEFLPLPIISDRWWVVDMEANAALYAKEPRMWELAWTDATSEANVAGTAMAEQAAQGVPVAWTRGSWLLVDLGDGRTLVEYFSWSDPGGHIPAGASRFGGSAVTQTLKAVADLAQESRALSRAGYTRPDGSPL
ncbi:MAG: hypothetical protein R3F61_24655 [Myxococcota bacterium]